MGEIYLIGTYLVAIGLTAIIYKVLVNKTKTDKKTSIIVSIILGNIIRKFLYAIILAIYGDSDYLIMGGFFIISILPLMYLFAKLKKPVYYGLYLGFVLGFILIFLYF